MRHKTVLSALTTVAVAATALATSSTAAASPDDARITISDQATGMAIPPELVGVNHRWPNGGLGMWDGAADRPEPTMVELSKRAGLNLVRYPGGTVANLFDWKKAIGPQSDRGCQVGGGFVGGREPMDSVYGVEEHQRFVAEIGATTQIMANASTASVQDIADFVEYMNAPAGTNPNGGTAWAQVRADNGHPEPYGVRWWELGNELYLGNQFYWRSSDLDISMRQYAFGGTQRQVDQPLGTECDFRPSAGVSSGAPGQRLRVNFPPVVPDSQTIRIAGETWQEVSQLSSAGPEDKVYTIDDVTGAVAFGDGTHGAVPPAGSLISADYDSGPHPGFVHYYAAMKAVDPGIQVCSAWEKPEFVELMGDEHPYDCIGPHLYNHPAINVPYEQIYDQLMVGAHEVLGEIRELKKAIARHRPDDRPAIEVSEYGTIALKGTGPGPLGWNGSMMHSLYIADLLAGMVHHDVRLGSISNLNEDNRTLGELFGGSVPGFHYTARANVLKLFSHLAGSQPLAFEVPANPRATGDGGYTALQVVAACGADGTVRVLVVNRDRERALTTQLQVADLAGPATASVYTLNGPSYTSYNSPAQPDVVRIQTSRREVSGPAFTHQFPAHSVTLLEIPAVS